MKKSITIKSFRDTIFVFMVATIFLKLVEKRGDWLIVSFVVALSFYVGIIVYDVETFVNEMKNSKVVNIQKTEKSIIILNLVFVFIYAMIIIAFLLGVFLGLDSWLDLSFRISLAITGGYAIYKT